MPLVIGTVVSLLNKGQDASGAAHLTKEAKGISSKAHTFDPTVYGKKFLKVFGLGPPDTGTGPKDNGAPPQPDEEQPEAQSVIISN